MSQASGQRAKIYEYLRGQGIYIDKELHKELKDLLLEYVQIETAQLQNVKVAYENHIKQCEYNQRRLQGRADRRKSKNNNPAQAGESK